MPQHKVADSSKRGGRKKALGLLRGIGLHGYEPVEDAFLAGLVLKEPVLLIGSIGTAKTLLAERVAHALGLKFHAYDASKAMFEDILGFPDPKVLLEERKVCYVPSDITIWDKEFILADLEAYRMRCVSVESALHLPNATKNVLMRMAYKIARQQEKRGQHDLFENILSQILERLKHGGLLCLSQG